MNDLTSLHQQVKACTRCPLRENATQPVPGIGKQGAKYLLLGEAPGKEEDKFGFPFIGLSGKRLNKLMELARIDQNDCYLTNTVKCRPPANRDPRKAETRACWEWLRQEIELVKPEYIITLGSVPLKLFTDTGVRALHGTMFEVELDL